MNFSKPKTAATQPVVRKTTIRVPVARAAVAPRSKPASRPDPDRFRHALERPAAKSSVSRKPSNPARRALSAARGVKRKSATPQPALFSSDEDEDDEISGGGGGISDIVASDSDASRRKRIKSSASPTEEDSGRPARSILCERAFRQDSAFDIVHGADATSGEHAHKYKNPWAEDGFVTAALQYPSRSPKERFELKWPRNETDDYKPMEDIIETIKTICTHYFPPDLARRYMDDETGFGRRFNRAWQRESVAEFVEVVRDFNSVTRGLLHDGSIERGLAARSAVSLDLVKRVLEQIYSRTVSPKVESLRAYQNGSDNVYGELLPRFVSDIFRRTQLRPDHVFIDLGSGVGNVVLQAALEVGCESWGFESMPNPCDLAARQAAEFPARARLWGLAAGPVRLLRADFTADPRARSVLQRADLVLVNNQAFTPALNATLRDMFFDLKDGCRVVSLKPFVPEGHRIALRNYSSVASLFVQERFDYFSQSVSWTDRSGHYYVATKDPKPLAAFLQENGLSS